MADPLQTGANALLAFQRAISTTSHNIANSGTEGYTRQTVDMQATPAIRKGFGYVGQGVEVHNVRRMADEFANTQLLQTGSELARLNTLHGYASQIDSLLSTDSLDLTASVSNFFNAIQDANNNPTDMAARSIVVSNAESLTNKYSTLYEGIDAIRSQSSRHLSLSLDEINEITVQVADLDRSIIAASSQSGSRAPNDLLDQRERLLNRLAEQVDIHTIDQSNGSVDIYIANGQSLLTGGFSRQLVLTQDASEATELPIAITDGTTAHNIGNQLSGGTIGGIADFRRNVLAPATNELGRLVVSFTSAMNAQHALGIDANGATGQDLFQTPDINIENDSGNTGTGTLAATFSDTSLLTTSDYRLDFDGLDYTLTRLSDNNSVTGGPNLSMDGILVSVGGSMNAGDSFTLAPTRYAARDVSTLLLNGEQLALGSALRAETSLSNTSSATARISSVQDPSDPEFNTAVDIVFNDPPATYNVVEQLSGTVIANNVPYNTNDQLSYNGWTAQLSGNPASADTFSIEPNLGGIASNENGVALASVQQSKLIEGSSTLSAANGSLLGEIGTRTRQAGLNSDSMQSMHNRTLEKRDNVAAVNLDEEAINLTRYQQAYQAAAQIINTSDQMFQTLIGALR